MMHNTIECWKYICKQNTGTLRRDSFHFIIQQKIRLCLLWKYLKYKGIQPSNYTISGCLIEKIKQAKYFVQQNCLGLSKIYIRFVCSMNAEYNVLSNIAHVPNSSHIGTVKIKCTVEFEILVNIIFFLQMMNGKYPEQNGKHNKTDTSYTQYIGKYITHKCKTKKGRPNENSRQFHSFRHMQIWKQAEWNAEMKLTKQNDKMIIMLLYKIFRM